MCRKSEWDVFPLGVRRKRFVEEGKINTTENLQNRIEIKHFNVVWRFVEQKLLTQFTSISNFIQLRWWYFGIHCDWLKQISTHTLWRRKSITGFYREDDEENLLCVKMWMKIHMKLTLKKLHMLHESKYVHMKKTMLRVVAKCLWSRKYYFAIVSDFLSRDLLAACSLTMNEKCSQRTLS